MTGFKQRHSKQAAELLNLMRDLARRHRSLVSRLCSAELLADGIAFDIARIEKCLEAGALAHSCVDDKASRQKEKGQIKEQLRLLADSGAATLEIKPRSDGLCEVRIDAGKRFNLPPVLSDLLSVLALNGGASEDGLIGWKTLDEVAILLGKRSGKRFSKHTVTQSIYRLRRELFKRGGANPFLVQTNRRRGVRFALKQRIVPVIESD